jgi:hypothetical protein
LEFGFFCFCPEVNEKFTGTTASAAAADAVVLMNLRLEMSLVFIVKLF